MRMRSMLQSGEWRLEREAAGEGRLWNGDAGLELRIQPLEREKEREADRWRGRGRGEAGRWRGRGRREASGSGDWRNGDGDETRGSEREEME